MPHSEESLSAQYTQIWSTFAEGLQRHLKEVGTWAKSGDGSVHELLQRSYWTPKHHLKRGVKADDGHRPNVGSATGLFFETLCQAAISERIGRQEPGLLVERNTLGGLQFPGAPAQPDLLVHHPTTGRRVVFEFKAAPKKKDLASVRRQRDAWMAHESGRFYLVAGLVGDTQVAELRESPWAAILWNGLKGSDARLAGMTRVDDLIDDAVGFLFEPTS